MILIIDINLKKSIVDEIGFAFNDIIETYGAPIAHDNEQDVLVRLSDLIGNDKTVAYENSILSEYRPLTDADGILNSIFVFPNTKFSWSQKEKAWYNASSVNLSNIGSRDVNAAIDAALAARPSWSALPWNERAAVFLKAADLIAGPYRAKINAATMLAQSKNIFQA